ncbi:hypothetical protein MAC_03449 [Metarhizium acridum CQMa 102]|uniref:Transcription factor domain-containing protein n=1 Tax=Metarhizium acridum (strain CQMa 102) TaxID=655827 RepID=E9E0Q1_METAQ|nr:uncharacterized protein MAC_03449 [Metarhizium acridum CQMa 102]EFY90455.1 hypothetical protein MAC_03449 [Metarhizium acridum CQMa 102]
MGDSLGFDDGRLAKRVRLVSSPELHNNRETEASSQQQVWHPPPPLQLQREHQRCSSSYEQQQGQSSLLHADPQPQHVSPPLPQYVAASAPSTGIAMVGLPAADDWCRNYAWSNEPSATTLAPPSHLQLGACRNSLETGHIHPTPSPSTTYGAFPAATTGTLYAPSDPTASTNNEMLHCLCHDLTRYPVIPTTSQLDFPPTVTSETLHSSGPTQFEAAFTPPISRPSLPSDDFPVSSSGIVGDDHPPPQCSHASRHHVFHSPFRDCIGTFGLHRSQFFSRPIDGKVNGYIKFSWPKEKHGKQRSTGLKPSIPDATRVVEIDGSTQANDELAPPSSTTFIGPSSVPSKGGEDLLELTVDLSSFFNQPSTQNFTSHTPVWFTSSSVSNSSNEVACMGAPKMLPSQYGYEAKMDDTDRRFWMFYIRNWCPGRSVLEDTNLWLKDFAQMHKSVGVRSAIQSLAGIYIYDYLPLESIRNRVNQRFSDAEERFSQLLNDPMTATDETQANELITIAVILSMQDIVLTERRLKKPFSPRWLQGFRQGEQFLQATDHGSRFWKSSNVQSSSLRNSQSIIVGRAVILAQPLSSLPPPHKFDAQQEASRFGWLLYGTEKDMYQIHGGCGFSKKLLHVLNQVTYCAARLQQEPESPVVPMTADYLYRELLQMRQWSPESKSWEAAQSGLSVIDWVRSVPENYQIDTNAFMTDVTAEAWRFAAIIYLQCRVMRLPRNHSDVVSNLDDLARCITIMPTSGSQFTAQAPLFPVFLLGMLATKREHKAVSENWFDEVLQTPVRSTNQPIHLRNPWWERLVTLVQKQEQEFLCLT